MVRGYNRRYDKEQHTIGNILAAVYNTIPRSKGHKKGTEPYTADDFTPKKSKDLKIYTPEERIEMAKEGAEKMKRFGKGVVKTVV